MHSLELAFFEGVVFLEDAQMPKYSYSDLIGYFDLETNILPVL